MNLANLGIKWKKNRLMTPDMPPVSSSVIIVQANIGSYCCIVML